MGFIPATGGPDAFGYTYRDSRASGGPMFNWLDLTSLGSRLGALDNRDNERAGPVSLGFSFSFYGRAYDAVYADSNGLLSFAGPAGFSPPGNQSLLANSAPPAVIAPFWDDLVTWHADRCPTASAASGVYTYRGGQGAIPFFAVSWVDLDHFNCVGAHYTFGVLLYADGRILVQHYSLQGQTTSATIGVRSPDGASALQYLHNGAGLGDGRAIEFRPPPPPSSGETPLLGTLREPIERGNTPTSTATPLSDGTALASPSPVPDTQALGAEPTSTPVP